MLLMREKVQPILDRAGLGSAHVEIRQKTLVIVGECGEDMVYVKGIQFAKTAMTNKERVIAARLFSEFMVKNDKAIKGFVVAVKRHLELESPDAEDVRAICEKYGFISILNYPSAVRAIFDVGGKARITIAGTGSTSVSNAKSSDDIVSALDEASYCIKDLYEMFSKIDAYSKSQSSLNTLRGGLGKCNI